MYHSPIFDKGTRIKMDILTTIGNTSVWFSSEKLSMTIDIEKKTILKYCRELAVDATNFNNGITILINKSKGVFLEKKDELSLVSFKLFIIENTLAIKLMKRLLFNQPCSLAQLEQELFISESTIRRKIRTFKSVIAEHNITIAYKNNNYILTGDEAQIRMYALMSFWITYKGNTWPFPMIDEKKMIRTIDKLLDHHGIQGTSINETDKRLLTYILAITVVRFHLGKPITWTNNWNSYAQTNTAFDLDNILQEYFLSRDELNFFSLILQTFVKTYDFQKIGSKIIASHKENNTPAFQATEIFFATFQEYFTIDLDDQAKQKTYGYLLSSHLFADIFKNFNLGISGIDVNHEAKENFPHLSKKLYAYITELADTTELSLFQEKDTLHMRYLLLFSSFKNLTVFEPKIHIYFESDLPDFSEKIIQDTISNMFANWYNISFNTQSDQPNDLVIISSSMPKIQNINVEEKEVIYIDSTVSADDFNTLNKVLKRIRTKQTDG
ncbi:helix-turn-helix domain-containing protein [Enterococcus termitis]|uniref:Mga helix-turn-helix domain-containing protein n=1 Tax=Enterococcus termitis TaxID=332950 RepID=A0A1E5GAX2_9ENTE|nr:helix-turn-helix domain-containing protein [Enterococcus termitis]OEG09854.1 hypothetical protein BCR25_10140 [Enterococcus termitis]